MDISSGSLLQLEDFYLLHALLSQPRNPWPSNSFYLKKLIMMYSGIDCTRTCVAIGLHKDANSLVAFLQES